jgi:hypothetical protein
MSVSRNLYQLIGLTYYVCVEKRCSEEGLKVHGLDGWTDGLTDVTVYIFVHVFFVDRFELYIFPGFTFECALRSPILLF